MSDDIPRTDICEDCEREITAELVAVDAKHELIHQARREDRGVMSLKGGSATVRFSCSCSSVDVDFEPGTCPRFNVPDSWLWESEFPELVNDPATDGERA